MKKLMFIILFAISIVYCETLVADVDLNVRVKPSAKAEVCGEINKGDEFEILEKYADYIKIEIAKGKDKKHTSDHVGKIGWMWSERIDVASSMIISEGCTLRSTPELLNNGTPEDTADDPNFVAKVKKLAAVKIMAEHIIFYKIQVEPDQVGWVSASYCKIK